MKNLESVFGRISGVCQPYVGRISAVIHRISAVYILRMSTVCQPSVSRMLAVYRPFLGRISAVELPMSAVCPPYVSRMSAIPNLPICLQGISQIYRISRGDIADMAKMYMFLRI